MIAEGRMQAANGNFGLAIDAFRRAIRQLPQSIEAYDGLAASYDHLGRFDLAQRYYEEALAFAPADPHLQAHYAASLRAHGMIREAEQLEALAAAMPATPAAQNAAPEEAAAGTMGAAPLAPLAQVASTMASVSPPAQFVPAAQRPAVTRPVPEAPQSARPERVVPEVSRPSGPYLERLSTGEVALITRPANEMSAENGFRRAEPAPAREPVVASVLRTASQSVFNRAQPRPPSARVAPRSQVAVASQPAARILNAVGRRGQASRMETHLRSLGWQQTSIGDAQARRAVSVILTPAATARQATELASSLPFRPRVVRSARVRQVVLVLGNDAVVFDQRLLRGGRRS